MTTKHVALTWEAYRKLCIRRELTETEEAELRQAFFAGSATLYEGIIRGLSDGPGESLDDLAFMERIHHELREFGHELDWRVLAFARKRGRTH